MKTKSVELYLSLFSRYISKIYDTKKYLQCTHLKIRSTISRKSAPIISQAPTICSQHGVHAHGIHEESYKEVVETETDCKDECELVYFLPTLYDGGQDYGGIAHLEIEVLIRRKKNCK